MLYFIFCNIVAVLCGLASPIYATGMGFGSNPSEQSVASTLVFSLFFLVSQLIIYFYQKPQNSDFWHPLIFIFSLIWLIPMSSNGPNFTLWFAARFFS